MAQDQEAVLFSVIALASLFYNTVQGFGNIHSSQNDERDEKILLTQLGVEQARLMIWGDIVGILSPPASLLAHAPYPTDGTHSLYNGPRDARLEEDDMRRQIEDLLHQLSHTLSDASQEEIAKVHGLKSWHRGIAHTLEQPAVDTNRVSGLEAKYAEVLDIASTKSALERPRRSAMTQWVIFDTIRFTNFVKSTKSKVDKLVALLGTVTEAEVERNLIADIQKLGEHPENAHDQVSRSAERDLAKLKFIIKACKGRYPTFVAEAQHAQQRIAEESGTGKEQSKHQWLSMPKLPDAMKSAPSSPTSKRPGLISRLSTQTFKRSGRKTPTASRPGSPTNSTPTTPGAKSRPTTPGAKSRPTSPGA